MGLFDKLKNEFGKFATAIPATPAIFNLDSGPPVAEIAIATPPKEKPEIPPKEDRPDPVSLPDRVDWESPVFGKLFGGPVLEMSETTFTLIHPLTGERVTLSKEWLVTMDERSAILEYEAGLPREEADRKARGMLFNQFREGGKP